MLVLRSSGDSFFEEIILISHRHPINALFLSFLLQAPTALKASATFSGVNHAIGVSELV
jgi:hypothetical protein